ncbi:hypothetical protein [Rhizobium sp. Root1220]|uniref:hypothetical protein n=1 Tax=Rhizobium sp. Root1220 TaxID=1736432 RepID=UPI0006F6629A|nr:hypothetical protein [Rhizobium sp. Root1220]KQV81719.1 hypothetical protein ASC90_05270 [Rhizobium sp. Root1220]
MTTFADRWNQYYNESFQAAERNKHAVLLVKVGASAAGSTLAFAGLAQTDGPIGGFGVGGLIMFAGLAVGGLLGFLFSVPRVLARDNSASLAGAAGSTIAAANPKATAVDYQSATVPAAGKERLLGSNTNLERISEWLTTMLVGVGLTEVDSLGDRFRDFSDFLAEMVTISQGPQPAGILPAVGPFLLIAGLVSGFIFFYLYTRIYLSPLFLYVETILTDPGAERLKVEVTNDFREAAITLPQDNPMITYVSRASSLSVNDSLNVIASLLYQTDGYLKAIELGNKLASTPAIRLSRYWFLMAAAYGQKHHYLPDNAAADERRTARDSVLYAARKAVELSEPAKRHLKALTDPNAIDNDLQDFRDDSDFLRIVD